MSPTPLPTLPDESATGELLAVVAIVAMAVLLLAALS